MRCVNESESKTPIAKLLNEINKFLLVLPLLFSAPTMTQQITEIDHMIKIENEPIKYSSNKTKSCYL